MSLSHGKPHELTEEEKEFQEKYTDQVQVQDEQSLGTILSFLVALQVRGLSISAERFAAYKTVKDPNLSSKLLNLESSKEFKEIRSQVDKARDVFDSATLDKKTGVRKSETNSTKFLFSKTSIDLNSLNKARAQVMVGERFHKLVNTHEQSVRIDQATSLYGIQNKQEFAKKIGGWMKENPGHDFNDALHIVGRRQYALETVGKEEGKLSSVDNKKLKDAKAQILSKQKIEEAKTKSTEYAKSIQADAQKILTKIKTAEKGIDPLDLKHELTELGKEKTPNLENQKIETPTNEPISPIPQPPKEVTAQSAPEFDPYRIPKPTPSIPTPSPIQPTVVVAAPASLPGGLNTISNPMTPTSQLIPSSPFRSLPTSRLSSLFGKASELFNKFNPSSLIQRGLAGAISKLGLGAAARAAATTLLAGISGGSSLALSAGLALANKVLHLDKVMAIGGKAFLIFFVIILSTPVLLTLFVVSDQASLFGPLGTNQLQNIIYTNPKNIYSWNEFEEKYLTETTTDDLTWDQFNKSYLTNTDSFLSLNTDRHDDVKK
jgi:hypothetical protein